METLYIIEVTPNLSRALFAIFVSIKFPKNENKILKCMKCWEKRDVLIKVNKLPRCHNPRKVRTFCCKDPTSFKTESARSSSNKWTKTLCQDYLHCIANFCRALLIVFSNQFISSNTKRRKRMLNFVWNTWKFWWNETDEEILTVFPQNLWTLKFIFSRSRRKLFFGVISGNYFCI